jgi:outer membrane protein with beta-barrel domain
MVGRSIHCAVILLLTASAPAVARPRIGLEAGLHYAELTREADPSVELVPPTEYEPGWTVGMVVEQPLGRGLALVSGLGYLQAHDSYVVRLILSGGGPPVEYRFDFLDTFRSLTLPLRLEWRPLRRGAVVEGGVGVAYLLEAVNTADATSSSSPGVMTFREDVTDRYGRWNLSAGLGVGWDIPCAGGVGTLRLRYAQGLVDQVPAAALDRFTRAFQLEAGWRR